MALETSALIPHTARTSSIPVSFSALTRMVDISHCGLATNDGHQPVASSTAVATSLSSDLDRAVPRLFSQKFWVRFESTSGVITSVASCRDTRRTGASPRGICINSFPIVGLRCLTSDVVNLIPTAVFKIIESFRVFVQADNHINLVHCNQHRPALHRSETERRRTQAKQLLRPRKLGRFQPTTCAFRQALLCAFSPIAPDLRRRLHNEARYICASAQAFLLLYLVTCAMPGDSVHNE